MNILFLTMSRIFDLEQMGIYPDLLREFVKNGHTVSIAAPAERRFDEETNLKQFENYSVLRIKVGNLQKTNLIEKGIATILLESQFIAAIKKYYKNRKFDMVIYSTPPITFAKVIDYIKKRDGATSYLLLKDIFPQNAVDLGMFSKKSPIYRFFRAKEKELYRLSDNIGCMSQANVNYVLAHNPEVPQVKVEICPNCIEVTENAFSEEAKTAIREKYGLPLEKRIFVYGGNLGKPQGIDYLIECLKSQSENEDAFFLVVGSGTEYKKLENYYLQARQRNFMLLSALPKEEYETLVNTCDVGMIFLDRRFTIPNFPSRLLSYMRAKIPVLAVTDIHTDVGEVIKQGEFGWWCAAGEISQFAALAKELTTLSNEEIKEAGKRGFEYLKREYDVERAYRVIVEK